MEIYLGITVIIGVLALVVGLIIGIVGLCTQEGDTVVTGGVVMGAGMIAPLLLPLVIIAVPVLAAMTMLIEFEKIEEPDWWPLD